jgi:NUMOD4 motif/HNH endonuclease
MEHYKNFSLEPIVYQNELGLDCLEQWKDIPDYEGLYQVSDLGRVKRLDRYKNHSSGKGTFLSKEKIMKNNKSGAYYCVSLYKNLIIKNWAIHHLVSITFMNHYPMQNNLVIDHKDNIKEHNMLSNLQIITHRENSSKDRINSNGFTGVCKTIYGFVALIKYKEKTLNLGTYDTAKEASEKYNEAVSLIDANKDVFHLVKTRSNINSFTGVCKSKDKFQARIIINNKFVNLGIFDTAELAGLEYQKALEIKNNGGKVMPTENVKISEVGFKGIYKSGLNFRVRMSINGVNRDLGTFSNVELANERYLEAKKLISESKSIEHFYSKKHPNKIYKGVFKNGDKYQAKLTVNGKLNNLGSYDNPESARDVYEKAIFLLNNGQSIEHLIKRRN